MIDYRLAAALPFALISHNFHKTYPAVIWGLKLLMADELFDIYWTLDKLERNSGGLPEYCPKSSIVKAICNQEFFVFRVEIQFGPKTRDELQWVVINAIHECLTGLSKCVHRSMAVLLGYLFPHPFPESLNRIQVGAIAGQRHQGKA